VIAIDYVTPATLSCVDVINSGCMELIDRIRDPTGVMGAACETGDLALATHVVQRAFAMNTETYRLSWRAAVQMMAHIGSIPMIRLMMDHLPSDLDSIRRVALSIVRAARDRNSDEMIIAFDLQDVAHEFDKQMANRQREHDVRRAMITEASAQWRSLNM
jgi:hypothetical protein